VGRINGNLNQFAPEGMLRSEDFGLEHFNKTQAQ
jgi:hypothetical protein